MKRAFGFASLLAVAGLAGVLMHDGATDPGNSGFAYGLPSNSGFESVDPGKAVVDTFKLLIRDADFPSSAQDSTWGFADAHYDSIVEDTTGNAVRYVSMDGPSGSPDTDYFNDNGIYTGKTTTENNRAAPAFIGLVWYDISALSSGDRVESAEMYLSVMKNTTTIMNTGSIYVRADTVTADFAVTSTVSPYLDPSWFNTCWSFVDSTALTPWTPLLYDRDDWHDFGPRSQPFEYTTNDTLLGGYTLSLDVADPLQQILDNGNPGRGVLFAIYGIGTKNSGWQATTTATKNIGGNPALHVVTTSRRGVMAWGGTRIPIGFSFDDTRAGQKECFPSFASRGYTVPLVAYGDSWDAQDDSLIAADGFGNYEFVGHSMNHARLGDLTSGAGLDTNLTRVWYPRDIVNFTAADTTQILDYAWNGGTGTKKFGFDAIAGMIENGWRTSRGVSYTTATPIGEITYPKWGGFVNLFAVCPTRASALWGTDAAPFTQIAFSDTLDDVIDDMYTNQGNSALIIFSHGQTEGTTATTMEWLFDYIDAHTGVDFIGERDIMGYLASRPRVAPSSVTVANGAPAATVTAAAKFDSLITADGTSASWATQVWVGPYGNEPESTSINDIVVSNIPRLGVAFPGNVGAVDFGLLDALGIGMVRTNLKSSSGISGVSGNGQAFIDTLKAYGMTGMLTLCPDDSTETGTGAARDGMPTDLESWHYFVKSSAEMLDGDGTGDNAGLGDPFIYYGILNEWTGHNNTDGGWRGAYTETQITALIDTTKDALSSALGAKLVLGAPSGIYSDIMMMCDGVVSYTIKNETTTYTTDDCAAADTDSIKAVIDRAVTRSSIDYNDLHQYGPLEHNIARYAYTDSLWSTVGVVSSESGGPSLNYDEGPCTTDYFNYAWHLNLDAFAKGLPFTMWLQLFDTGNESAGNDDVPFLVGDGTNVTTYRPQWYAYKMLALCFEGASTCVRMEEGVYKITLSSGDDIYMMLAGFGDGAYTMPAGSTPLQAIKIKNMSSGTYILDSVPAAGDIVDHSSCSVIVSEKVLIN